MKVANIMSVILTVIILQGCASSEKSKEKENIKLAVSDIKEAINESLPLSDWSYLKRILFNPVVDINDSDGVVKVTLTGLVQDLSERRYEYTVRFASTVEYFPDTNKAALTNMHNFQWTFPEDPIPTSYQAELVDSDRRLIISRLGSLGIGEITPYVAPKPKKNLPDDF